MVTTTQDGGSGGGSWPTIKCSTCGEEMDMMALTDHICDSSQPQEQLIYAPAHAKPTLDYDPATQCATIDDLSPQLPSPRHLRPSRNVPARIDAAAANRSFFRADQSSPMSACSNYSDGHSSMAPLTPSTQVTTPSSIFSRKIFGSLTSRTPSPPSPDLASMQDSAFPVFPALFDALPRKRDRDLLVHQETAMTQSSPRPNVMQRMNTIAPGPFGAQRGKWGERNVSAAQPAQTQRNLSDGALTQPQLRSRERKQQSRNQSNASSLQTQSSVWSESSVDRANRLAREDSRQSGPANSIDRFLDETLRNADPPMLSETARSRTFPEGRDRRYQRPSYNVVPLPPAPPARDDFFSSKAHDEFDRPSTSAGSTEGPGGLDIMEHTTVEETVKPQNASNQSGFLSHSQPMDGRSRSRTVIEPSTPIPAPPTFEPFEQSRSSPIDPAQQPFQPWSAPGIFLDVTASNRLDDEPQGRSKTTIRPSDPSAVSHSEHGADVAPPTPISEVVAWNLPMQSSQPVHASSASDSSYASSRSTPPTSDGSMSRSGSNSDDGQKRSHSRLQKEWHPPTVRTGKPSPPPLPVAGGFSHSPESPMDPAIQRGVLTPLQTMSQPPPPPQPPIDRPLPSIPAGTGRYRPKDSPLTVEKSPTRVPGSLASTDIAPHTHTSPPQIPLGLGPTSSERNRPPPSVYQQPNSVSKGNCRGCGLPIYGKSVKAADGRLSGRFHKECFVCKKCQAPFPTAEFYVLVDAPYCGRHYHELNGSVCRKCNQGIEGQYLEIDGGHKYHANCFCCSQCMVRLIGGYYEVNGRPVCDRHTHHMPSRGGPAPVFERRRTKLMMI